MLPITVVLLPGRSSSVADSNGICSTLGNGFGKSDPIAAVRNEEAVARQCGCGIVRGQKAAPFSDKLPVTAMFEILKGGNIIGGIEEQAGRRGNRRIAVEEAQAGLAG